MKTKPTAKIAVLNIFLGLFSATTFAQNNVSGTKLKVSNKYHEVMARKNAEDTIWKSYTAKTIDKLPGFNYTKDPETDLYGAWKINPSKATGFFRT